VEVGTVRLMAPNRSGRETTMTALQRFWRTLTLLVRLDMMAGIIVTLALLVALWGR
jgi:hypothetical protein